MSLGTHQAIGAVCGALWLGSLAWLLATCALSLLHQRNSRRATSADFEQRPPVSVIVPVASPAPGLAAAVQSLLALEYPEFEILLVAAANDPAAGAAIGDIAAAAPDRIRCFVRPPLTTINPKVGLQAAVLSEARYRLLLFSDDNVVASPSRLTAHLARRNEGYALVSAVIIGANPVGFWASVDSAFMDAFARLQLAGASIGFAGVTGKSMLLDRGDLERSGGLMATSGTLCEDAALRGRIAAIGGRTGICREFAEQFLGRRDFLEVWNRHKRWSFCRRLQVPPVYAAEVLLSVPMGVSAAAVAGPSIGIPGAVAALGTAAVAILTEVVFVRSVHHSWPRFLGPWLVREMLVLPLAVAGFLGKRITWRRHSLRLHKR